MTTPSPIAAWLADAAAAFKNDSALVDATNADAAATASTMALGFLAQVASIGAPVLAGIIASSVVGPEGVILANLAAGALTNLGSGLAAEHANALSPLTPEQQALATQALTTGAALLADKLQPKA